MLDFYRVRHRSRALPPTMAAPPIHDQTVSTSPQKSHPARMWKRMAVYMTKEMMTECTCWQPQVKAICAVMAVTDSPSTQSHSSPSGHTKPVKGMSAAPPSML